MRDYQRFRIEAKPPGETWATVWDEMTFDASTAVNLYKRFHKASHPKGTKFRAVADPGRLFGTENVRP